MPTRHLNVVYCCFGGAHSSITCAAIHLNMLARTRKPSTREIINIMGFDSMRSRELGSLVYLGETGTVRVFAMGLRARRKQGKRMLYGFLEENRCAGDFCFVEALPTLHVFTFLGGMLSRRWGLKIGKPIVAMGIRASFGELVEHVKAVEGWVAGRQGGF